MRSLTKDWAVCFEAFEAGAGRMKILREGRRYISMTNPLFIPHFAIGTVVCGITSAFLEERFEEADDFSSARFCVVNIVGKTVLLKNLGL